MTLKIYFIIALITGRREREYCGCPIIISSPCFCDFVIVVVPLGDRYFKKVTYIIVITF